MTMGSIVSIDTHETRAEDTSERARALRVTLAGGLALASILGIVAFSRDATLSAPVALVGALLAVIGHGFSLAPRVPARTRQLARLLAGSSMLALTATAALDLAQRSPDDFLLAALPALGLASLGLSSIASLLARRPRSICLAGVSATLAASVWLTLLVAELVRLRLVTEALSTKSSLLTILLLALASLLAHLVAVQSDHAAGRSPLRWAPWAALATGLLVTAVTVATLQRWQHAALADQARTEGLAAANQLGTLLDNRLARLRPTPEQPATVDDRDVPGLLWYGRTNPRERETLFVAPGVAHQDEELATLAQQAPGLAGPIDGAALLRIVLPDGRPGLLAEWWTPTGQIRAVIDPERFFAPVVRAATDRDVALTLYLNGDLLLGSGRGDPRAKPLTVRVPSNEVGFGVLRLRTQLGTARVQPLLSPLPLVVGAASLLATLTTALALAVGWRTAQANQRLRALSAELRDEIEERRTIERLLAEREAWLQLLLRQLPAVVWTVDRDLVFTSSEGAGLAHLGLRPGQVVGQTLFEYLGTSDPDHLVIRAHRLALAGEPQEYEFSWHDRCFRVRLEPLRDPDGRITGVIGIAFDSTDEVRTREQLERLATTDELTGIANRASLLAHLDHVARAGEPFAALLIDLDGFKAVNDTFGHLVGDALLREVAQRLRRSVRQDDLVGRLGGDEFLVLARVQDTEGARELANRILVALTHPFRIDGQTIHLGGSVGIAFCDGRPCDTTEILRAADLALYEAKRRGKGRVVLFSPELAEETTQLVILGEALRTACETGTIRFAAQAVIHLRTGRVAGVELVPEWSDPQHGTYRGEELAALAERTGVAELLALRGIQECLDWLREMPKRSLVVLRFPQRALLADEVVKILREPLDELARDQKRLWLDLPTSLLRMPRDRQALQAVSSEGVGILVRDPVLTPEGIEPVLSLPRAGIRIPRGFVRSFFVDPRAAVLTHALLRVTQDLSLLSLADDIDEFAVFVALTRSGCTYGVGPLFGGELARGRAIAAAHDEAHWSTLARDAATPAEAHPDGATEQVQANWQPAAESEYHRRRER
jgi:diguanylate cyclase (GGDEF)-like protein/PAS domain S-box-containing protein